MGGKMCDVSVASKRKSIIGNIHWQGTMGSWGCQVYKAWGGGAEGGGDCFNNLTLVHIGY